MILCLTTITILVLAIYIAASWVIPDEGKIILLGRALQTTGAVAAEDYVCDLYQNNYTPVNGSTGSNFTVATFTGYSQVAMPRTDFPAPTGSGGVVNTTNSVPGAFTCTGGSPQTIYGCYVRGATSGKVVWASIFDATRSMATGATETVTVEIAAFTG